MCIGYAFLYGGLDGWAEYAKYAKYVSSLNMRVGVGVWEASLGV